MIQLIVVKLIDVYVKSYSSDIPRTLVDVHVSSIDVIVVMLIVGLIPM